MAHTRSSTSKPTSKVALHSTNEQRSLLPSKESGLAGCKLTEKSCEIVASALQSANSPLRELDLSDNDLQKSGEKLLSALQSPHCKLETLRVAGCKLTDESYKVLASAVQSAVSLTELDVGDNHMSVYAVQLLKTALLHTDCKLQTLRLSPNLISGDGCVCLAVTLKLNPSCATRLDLSNSPPEGPAQELLLATWRNPEHQVESLRLAGCKLTDKSCEVVADALQSANPLLELDLSDNELGDSGVEFLSKGLSSPHCKLQMLRLAGCKLTDESYKVLASAVQSAVSLTELDVGDNHMSVYAVQLLKTALLHTDCKLQTLRLAGCKLTDKSCEVVADALQSANPLLELDLSDNELGDSGVQFLSKGLSCPHCKLQMLRLSGCQISHKGCSFLASALKSNPSYLKELELSYNHPGDSGVRELTDRLNDPKCKLETLRCDHGGECRLKPGLWKYAYAPNPAAAASQAHALQQHKPFHNNIVLLQMDSSSSVGARLMP
ncbi:hypothetical protein ACEWY4_017423 [Coilia grayii]|uniref:Uncharacterized protein n=1 Tax=Coilia grayii TaxID=363190 RepID=A0ABD1JHW8_9TELE